MNVSALNPYALRGWAASGDQTDVPVSLFFLHINILTQHTLNNQRTVRSIQTKTNNFTSEIATKFKKNPRELRRPRNSTRNSIAALPIYLCRYSCPGVSSLTPLWCPRCGGMRQDPLCDWHSKLHLDFEVLLPVLRRPNPVRRRLCGLRQFFDEMFCLPVGKAYRSEKGVRGFAYKSSSTDFDGEMMDTISSCLEIHCEIQIPVALQSIAKIHSVFPWDRQFNQDEGVCRCWRQH